MFFTILIILLIILDYINNSERFNISTVLTVLSLRLCRNIFVSSSIYDMEL